MSSQLLTQTTPVFTFCGAAMQSLDPAGRWMTAQANKTATGTGESRKYFNLLCSCGQVGCGFTFLYPVIDCITVPTYHFYYPDITRLHDLSVCDLCRSCRKRVEQLSRKGQLKWLMLLLALHYKRVITWCPYNYLRNANIHLIPNYRNKTARSIIHRNFKGPWPWHVVIVMTWNLYVFRVSDYKPVKISKPDMPPPPPPAPSCGRDEEENIAHNSS